MACRWWPTPTTRRARSPSSSATARISPSSTSSCAPGSGLGVLDRLHAEPARYGHPRAVVLSNYGHGTVRARCHACGVEHFFDKSFQMDELLDFVQAQAARR